MRRRLQATGFTDAVLDERLAAFNADDRVPVAFAHTALDLAVRRSGDALLGLKTARELPLGAGGALDYAMHTANTLHHKISLVARYARFFSDSLNIIQDATSRQVVLVWESEGGWPAAAGDFALTAFFLHQIVPALGKSESGVECWFGHPEPRDRDLYDRTFGAVALRWNRPCYALAFDRELMERPLPTAQVQIHGMLCERLEDDLAALTQANRVSERVRQLIAEELPNGPTAHRVARSLRMSRRTLSRRLDDEGTTFREQLDTMRREYALRQVSSGRLSLSEIADRLGFAHVEAFHRAFKRWTGETPMGFRQKSGAAALD